MRAKPAASDRCCTTSVSRPLFVSFTEPSMNSLTTRIVSLAFLAPGVRRGRAAERYEHGTRRGDARQVPPEGRLASRGRWRPDSRLARLFASLGEGEAHRPHERGVGPPRDDVRGVDDAAVRHRVLHLE